MYMEETLFMGNKSTEGQAVLIRDSIGRGLKADSDVKGINLKVKHNIFHKIFVNV